MFFGPQKMEHGCVREHQPQQVENQSKLRNSTRLPALVRCGWFRFAKHNRGLSYSRKKVIPF